MDSFAVNQIFNAFGRAYLGSMAIALGIGYLCGRYRPVHRGWDKFMQHQIKRRGLK